MGKKKKRRNLSFKERVLLTILAVVGIVYITNSFFLGNAISGLETAETQLTQKLAQYEVITNEISNRVLYQERVDKLAVAEAELINRFPTELSEEVLLLKILGFADDSNVHIATYGISPVNESSLAEVSGSAASGLSEEEKIQEAVTAQAETYTAQVEEDIKKRYEEELGISTDEENETGMDPVSFKDLLDVSNNEALLNQLTALGSTVLTEDISISVDGNYEQMMHFIDLIEQDDQAIFVINSSYNASEDKIAANLTLRFVGYKDLEINGPVKATVPDDIGQSPDVFSEGDLLIEDGLTDNNEHPDASLTLILNSYLDNGPSFMIYQRNLDSSLRYHYENTTLGLTLYFDDIDGDENAVSYSYNLAGTRYSGKITDLNDDLVFEIISSERVDSNDFVTVKLSVNNQSSKNVMVVVAKDDEQSRLMIGELNGQVQVEK